MDILLKLFGMYKPKTIIVYSANWTNAAVIGETVAFGDQHAVVTQIIGNAIHLKYIDSK